MKTTTPQINPCSQNRSIHWTDLSAAIPLPSVRNYDDPNRRIRGQCLSTFPSVQEREERVKLIQNWFERHPQFRGRTRCLHFEMLSPESIVISGVVPSFYLKQLVQEIARKIPGLRSIDNQVHVAHPVDTARDSESREHAAPTRQRST